MRIPLNVLLYELSANAVYTAQNIDFTAEYEGVKLFDIYGDPSEMDTNYLYMVSEYKINLQRELWKVQHYKNITIVCLKGEEEGEDEINLDLFHFMQPVLILDPPQTFSYIFNRIVNVFYDFDKWNDRIQMALLQNQSAQAIIDLTKQYISHPMVVLDRSFSLLGSCVPDSVQNPILASILEQGYVSTEVMSELRKAGLITQAKNAPNPIIVFRETEDHETSYYMMYRFEANGYTVGYAIVFDCRVHPKTNYLYVMNLIVEGLKMYFLQLYSRKQSTSEVYETVLTELIESKKLNLEAAKDKLSYAPGLTLEGHFLVAHVDYGKQEELPYSFVCWNLRNAIPNLKPFIYMDHLYLLRIFPEGAPCDRLFTDEEESVFTSLFRGFPFACGVSQVFFSLMDLKNAVWQCDEALGISRKDWGQGFFYHKNLYIRSLLECLQKNGEMEHYISPDYLALKEYDEKHNSDLCDIYMKYLENDNNVNQTANVIFMHRNTVLNKVKKAISIMPQECDDFQSRIAFMLSYTAEH